MTSPPSPRGDQRIARQIIRRLLWLMRHGPCQGLHRYVTASRIRALWESR